MSNPYKLYIKKYSAHYYILKNIGRNKKVLDVGCNDGYIGYSSDKSNQFYGLDYIEESVKKSKKTYKDAVIYDLNNLKLLPWKEEFDVIIFADVLEHINFPDDVLKYFTQKYLKNDGTVIISLPNVANWKIRLGLLFGKFDYTETGILDRTHLHLYTFKSARELVNKSDLKIISSYGTSKTFGGIINVLTIFKSIVGINIILVCKKINNAK